jgi:hypothetical protein
MIKRSTDMARYFDLGSHSFLISTSSDMSQRWFDRGLAWCYGFNHEEAIRCFQNSITEDPTCAMGYWGIAYAKGPFYNKPWGYYSQLERGPAIITCHEACHKALQLSYNLLRLCVSEEAAHHVAHAPTLAVLRRRWPSEDPTGIGSTFGHAKTLSPLPPTPGHTQGAEHAKAQPGQGQIRAQGQR